MTVSPHRAGALAIGLVCLAGCSNLPREAALPLPTAAAASAPVPLRGPHGRLSPAQSRTVMARLQHDMPETDIFGRHLAVEDTLVDIPLTTGNAVRLLQDGPATYAAMFAAIDGAHDHIHLETYILDDDAIGRRFARVLKAKQAAGVQVVVIRDSAGTFGTPAAFFADLAAGGIRVLEFNPLNPFIGHLPWAWNRRDHRKLLIVDGQTGFIGGINIADQWLGRDEGGAGWRDDMVRIAGPAVAGLSDCFARSWARLHGQELRQVGFGREAAPAVSRRSPYGQPVRVLGQQFLRAQRQISRAYLHYLRRAERRIFIANSYFVPDGRVLRALAQAARRGVDVRIIVPGQSDVEIVRHASRAVWGRLLRAGVRIFEWDESVLHAKSAVVDGRWSTTGTFNFDYLSLRLNLEVNLSVLDEQFAQALEASFLADFAQCREVSRVDFRFRPLGQRLLEFIAYRLRKFL